MTVMQIDESPAKKRNCLFELTYRVAQKSRYRKKIKYLHYSSSKRVDFFVSDRGMFKLHIHKDMLRKILL